MRSRFPYVATGVVVGLLFNAGLALAWTGPSATAPGSNIAAPVNVGSSLQVKSGDLTTNSHTVYGDLKLSYGWNPSPSTITYLNFSNAQNPTAPTWGLNGYGIRDNNGTLEFKNSGDTGGTSGWKTLQSLISGVAGFWTASGNNISNSNSGNVGIGTSAPTAKLDVTDGTNPSNFSSAALAVRGTGNQSISINTLTSGSAGLFLHNSGANAFRISANRTTPQLEFDSDSDGVAWGGTPLMVINASAGNVGVGVATPGYKLDVNGQVNAAAVSGAGGYISTGNYGGTGSAAYFPQGIWSNGTSAWIYGAISTNGAISDTTNRMRMNPAGTSYFNGGNLGVGTVSPGYRLQVVGVAADWATVINWPPGTPNGYGVLVGSGAGKYSQFQNAEGYYAQLANSSWGVYSNGNLGAAGFYYISDRRLKDNVQALDDGLVTLMKLRPVSFTWNEKAGLGKTGKGDIGLIAQEVEKVLPEAVSTNPDGYKTVDYPKLVPILIKAIQEQQSEIELLKADLKALKAAK